MSTTPPPTKRFGAPFEALSIDEAALARDFEPSSFGFFYDDEARPKPYRMAGDVAVVDVVGALDTRAGWWWDGYDAIVERAAAALADPKVRALVLSMDSPGGMAAGNLDACHALRAVADASGKPVVAHAGTMAASAAYALACAADQILVTSDGVVGSIGTIATVYDRTALNEKIGLDVRVVRSGNLKADPHPDVALTDASVARVRARVNELAQMFAAHVAARRPQAGDPLALQGACFYGADAVTRGLADAVGTLADAITTAAHLAADSRKTNTMDPTATKAVEITTALCAATGATTVDELVATVATLRQRAGQVDAQAVELTALRQQLADRDAAAIASARADVLSKHRVRGAFTPAMEADAEYMGDLAPLSPAALDRVLSKLPAMPAAVAPRAVGAVDPGAVDADPGAIDLTAEDKAWCASVGVSEASMLVTKRLDATRRAARQG